MIKYTAPFLSKLEDIFAESDFSLRYEKGNFKSGFCILKDNKVVVVNKYFTLEGKVNCLVEILNNLDLDISNLTDKSKSLYHEIRQTKLSL